MAVSLHAQLGPPKAEVAPILETADVRPGSTVHAALQVHLPEGYHTNSNKPRDPNLIPISVTFDSPPEGITFTEVVFPPATDLAQRGADQPLRVFSGDFAIGVALAVGPAVPSGSVKLPAMLRYQACDEVACYAPARAPIAWDLTVAKAGGQKQHADVFSKIRWGSGEPPKLAEAATAVPILPAVVSRPAVPTDELAALDRFTLKGTTFGYLDTSDFLTFIHNAENGIKEKGMFEGRGPLAILLLVLIGGLALNLTPCVLPMIPINLAIIGAGVQAGSRSRGFLLGAAYGAAMAFVYGLLGLAVILTASTFGTINASPWFNLGIAILFIILGLAMFDIVMIDFSRFLDRFHVGESNRGSFLVAFGMGAVAALLAGACVAPVVIQVVVFSSNLYATGTTAALALPFLLGLGMAIPWPLAGAGIAALPKPGAWMIRIKQVFGVVILGTALYYGYEAYGTLRQSLGRRDGSVRERGSKAQGRLARVTGRRARHGSERKQTGPDRHVGNLVQELPRHGQDDAGRPNGFDRTRRLRESEISGGESRRPQGRARHAEARLERPADVRDSAAEELSDILTS